ncbi:MAG TPA: hypothetical protein VKB16_16195 [Beijerinckiaceae bacterium]|jgi:hypothetical protein|nr:hypothetical protein [Beijerinckiaceae bacterium]
MALIKHALAAGVVQTMRRDRYASLIGPRRYWDARFSGPNWGKGTILLGEEWFFCVEAMTDKVSFANQSPGPLKFRITVSEEEGRVRTHTTGYFINTSCDAPFAPLPELNVWNDELLKKQSGSS